MVSSTSSTGLNLPNSTIYPTNPMNCTMIKTLILLLALSLPAHPDTFSQGDRVKLTRNEPLLFHDEVFRAGKEGESLTVLTHRPERQRVFVLGKDSAGKDIALSVAQDAVALVPVDTADLQRKAVALVKAENFTDAARLIDQAIRAEPSNPILANTKAAIGAASAARERLDAARANLGRVTAQAKLLRKNAAAIDRPNRLNANDNTSQQRAERMRAEAAELETAVKQELAEAEDQWRGSVAALAQVLNSPASVAKAGGISHRTLKDWQEDPATVPTGDISASADPSYETTIEFINGMIQDDFPSRQARPRLWFGKSSRKMIMQSSSGVVAFDPKLLTPDVKYSTGADGAGRHYVELSCTNGRPEILIVATDGKRELVKSFRLLTADRFDRDKLVKACQHLIGMFGGKEDPF